MGKTLVTYFSAEGTTAKVAKEYAEKIGTKLLQFALSDKGAKWLWVLEQNERGILFYKRNGFDFTGDTMLEDKWIPLKKMAI